MLENEVYQKIIELSPEYRPYIQIKTIADQLEYPIGLVNKVIEALAEQQMVTVFKEKVRLKK